MLALVMCMQQPHHKSPGGRRMRQGSTCTPLLGMGRLSFISATPGGRSFLYQGCRWMSGMVIRLAGSGTRMRFIRSRHSREAFTWGGNSYSTFRILCSTHSGCQRTQGRQGRAEESCQVAQVNGEAA